MSIKEEIWLKPSEIREWNKVSARGVGKTRMAEILSNQDIRREDVAVLFDPLGDTELMMRYQIEAKRAL